MAEDQEATLARVRANAARAGVTLSEEDMARIARGAYFGNADAFARLVLRYPSDVIPDDLKYWSPAAGVEGDGE
jgi:hypothetical protein